MKTYKIFKKQEKHEKHAEWLHCQCCCKPYPIYISTVGEKNQKILQKLQPENKFQAFLCLQRIKHNFYWKMKLLKQATFIRHVLAKLSNADFLIFFFRQDFVKIKNDLELVFRPYFSDIFLIKTSFLFYYINWPNFITRLCLVPKLFSKMYFVFHAQTFDDIMKFEYLKS